MTKHANSLQGDWALIESVYFRLWFDDSLKHSLCGVENSDQKAIRKHLTITQVQKDDSPQEKQYWVWGMLCCASDKMITCLFIVFKFWHLGNFFLKFFLNHILCLRFDTQLYSLGSFSPDFLWSRWTWNKFLEAWLMLTVPKTTDLRRAEMTQWIKVLAAQAGGPEFEFQHLHNKPGTW